MPGPLSLGGRGIFVTFFSQKAKVSSGIRPNIFAWKYNVYSIKLEMKVLCLHRIRVKKISLSFANKYAVHGYDYFL